MQLALLILIDNSGENINEKPIGVSGDASTPQDTPFEASWLEPSGPSIHTSAPEHLTSVPEASVMGAFVSQAIF